MNEILGVGFGFLLFGLFCLILWIMPRRNKVM